MIKSNQVLNNLPLTHWLVENILFMLNIEGNGRFFSEFRKSSVPKTRRKGK